VRRSRIVLRAADGVSNNAIANELGLTRTTVLLWRSRFKRVGVDGLTRDRPRGQGKPPLPEIKIRAVVDATLQRKPKGATHWSEFLSDTETGDLGPDPIGGTLAEFLNRGGRRLIVEARQRLAGSVYVGTTLSWAPGDRKDDLRFFSMGQIDTATLLGVLPTP